MRSLYMVFWAIVIVVLVSVCLNFWYSFKEIDERVGAIKTDMDLISGQIEELRDKHLKYEMKIQRPSAKDCSGVFDEDWVKGYFRSGKVRNPFERIR